MSQDSFPIRRLDHVRHYVNNARQSAYYYQHVFGFNITGYGGLETGQRNQVDWLLTQKDIRLIFSAPVRPDHPLSEKICEHGDYVQDIAFEVNDVDWSYKTAVGRGAKSAREPFSMEDDHGTVRIASICTFGDTWHSFINRDKYKGHFWPGMRKED